jgi:hypothetical protein
VEIVGSQMTKTHLFTRWSGWDDVVNLDIRVGDDDTVNQELDELPLLLPGRLGEARAHTRAKRFHGLHDTGQVLLVARFRLKLGHLACHGMELVLQPLTPALLLLQWQHLVQIGFGEAFHLARHAGLAVLQLRAARLKLLW